MNLTFLWIHLIVPFPLSSLSIDKHKPGSQKIFRGQPNISVGQPILI